MEASSSQQQKEKEPRVHRPHAFDKMEELVREMQDPDNGVPVRSQKQFLTSVPSAFMGYDLIEWLMDRLAIEESVEAVHIANQLCQYGYFFPVNDSKTLTVKDDSSLYRFQTPYYWPWQHKTPDNVEYAIYLAKRTLKNKQRHALDDYEIEALNSLRKNLQNKWEIIQLQAEEQVQLSKDRKKGDKIVSESQERAFWRIHRPPPGYSSSLEIVPIPTRSRPGLPRPPSRKRTITDLEREVELLKNSLTRTRIKLSTAIENLKSYFVTYVKYDPMFVQPQPSNPWITDDHTFWQLNSSLVEIPTEKRVKRWTLSMEEIMSDPTGLQEFTNYLRKEYSHENIRFWLAVKDLRHSQQAQIHDKVNEIFKEFLAPGAPCEINIDGKTMEKVHQEMKNPSRFTFDSAAEHVYTLLLKKDCYPRFIRSDHYRALLAAGAQPLQKKRFFNFGVQAKKKVASTSTTTPSILQQQHGSNISSSGRRRGSDRSLSGSAHELAVCSIRDIRSATKVPHSHSQSNLTDIPYRSEGDRSRGRASARIESLTEEKSAGSMSPREDNLETSSNSIRHETLAQASCANWQVTRWKDERGDLAPLLKIPTRPSPHSVQDAGSAEASVRPMDDVCPWDAIPGPSGEASQEAAAGTTITTEATPGSSGALGLSTTSSYLHEVGRTSRKNSTQFDSCSSSSDVSFAIAEVSDRLRKSCSLQHSGGPTITRNYSTGSTSSRAKLSDIGRPSASCNYPSPQQSFDYSHGFIESTLPASSAIPTSSTMTTTTTTTRMLTAMTLTLTTTTTTTTSLPDEPISTLRERSPSKDREATISTARRLSTKAPLISISAIVGDLPCDDTTADVATTTMEERLEEEEEEEDEVEVETEEREEGDKEEGEEEGEEEKEQEDELAKEKEKVASKETKEQVEVEEEEEERKKEEYEYREGRKTEEEADEGNEERDRNGRAEGGEEEEEGTERKKRKRRKGRGEARRGLEESRRKTSAESKRKDSMERETSEETPGDAAAASLEADVVLPTEDTTQVVPIWKPNAKQEDQVAPTAAQPCEKRDNNVNEVCPWEDDNALLRCLPMERRTCVYLLSED